MENYTLYADFIKPSWAPPAELFGPVWTVLYIIIAISFGYAAYLAIKKRISFTTFLPFLLNLAFNVIFTPIQFGLQSNILASIDIVLVLGTLIWAMAAIWKHARWVALANIPYLAWVSFATVLQFTITYLKW
ncbi:MAG: TspO/MBR family protein [bacterium]|nr:TspO/MBR family protein [bacterium]